MRILGIVTFAAAVACGGAAAVAEDVNMTGDEIRQVLIGNKAQYTTPWGYAEAYRDPNGTIYVRNSKGERGRGTWSIDGDKICLKWTEKHYDWRTSDSCTTLTRIDETTVKTDKGVEWSIATGDPTKVKLD